MYNNNADITIGRNEILEEFFNAVSDTREWGDTCEGKNDYFNFIDGLTTMTQIFLNKFESNETE